MKRSIYLTIIMSFVLCAGISFAQSELSLKMALKTAYENNPSVVEARKDVQIAEVRYKASRKWENPELELEARNLVKDLEGDSKVNTKNLESEIRLTQPVSGWGKKRLLKKIADDELKQQEEAFKQIWGITVKDIKEQYTQTLLSKKAVELAQENLTLNQKFLDQTKIKFDSGGAANYELSRAKLEIINARNNVLSSQKDLVINKGKLNLLLGEPMTHSYRLVDSFSTESLDQSYEELLKLSLDQRSDVLIQQKELDKKHKQLKLAKRQRLPSYDVSVFIEREEQVYNGGVGLAFELPIWNLKSNEIRQAKLEKQKADSLLSRLKNEAALEVYTAFHEADLAKKSHDISIEAIYAANEILQFTTLSYEEGEISFLSYLENIKAYQETKLQFFKSLSYYTIKIAQLEQVIGKDFHNE